MRSLGRGLLQPVGYQRERRELAKARKAAFVEAPTRRNRVWQTDFSELETAAGGTWQISGVVDYVAKLALCCPVTTTKTWRDAVAALENARSAVQDLLGVSLLEDCTCPDTGALTPVIVVSDNGPCYRASGFARYIASRPELSHVRTRHRSPGTNGVIERFYESIKYEHLYRHEIDDGPALAEHVDGYLDVYNQQRPHEALQFALPIDATPQPRPPRTQPRPHPQPKNLSQLLDAGQSDATLRLAAWVSSSLGVAVISEEELMDVRALARQGYGYAEIGRLLGRDWRTVKRYLEDGAQPVYRRRRVPSKLDEFKPLIDQWLAAEPRLLATRVHQDLVRDYGFTGSYNTVRRYTERTRPRPEPRTSERFETAAGHQAQIDWSHEQPIRTLSGLELPLFCFHMVLGHSRDSFCALTGSQDLVTFWACHRAAFAHFGGVPFSMRLDMYRR